MRRRDLFSVLSGGVAALSPVLVRAQRSMPTVGVTVDAKKSIGTPAVAEPFLRFMKELGWEEGRNYHALFLWTERNHDRLPDLVRELVTQRVDVIVLFGNPAIDAAREATKTIPIVGLTDDMVKSGHADNMAQP